MRLKKLWKLIGMLRKGTRKEMSSSSYKWKKKINEKLMIERPYAGTIPLK